MMINVDLNSWKAMLWFCGGLKFGLPVFYHLLFECSLALFWLLLPSLFC